MKRVEFVFERWRLRAAEGQTVAAALLAHGVHVFGRSSKYHRPRGVRCMNGTCSCCAMRVDGLPGVRTCVTLVREGMQVQREHAWPSAGVDVLRAAELAGPALHAGAYYGWFRRSPRLWRRAERVLAAGAGQGRLPDREAAGRFAAARCRTLRGVDVLVVGGGVAGVSAGLAAADAGAHVLLVERHHAVGGGLAGDLAPQGDAARDTDLGGESSAHEMLQALAGRAHAHRGLDLLLGAEVAAWYEEGVAAVSRGRDLLLVEPAAVVLATGGHELMPPFANGDLPGVMTGFAAQRLLQTQGVPPGRVAVVLATGARGYAVAVQLLSGGVAVAAVADLRPARRVPETESSVALARGIRVLAGVDGVRAHGLGRVNGVTIHTHAEEAAGHRTLRLRADLVCSCVGLRPADELARQALAVGRHALSGRPGIPAGPIDEPAPDTAVVDGDFVSAAANPVLPSGHAGGAPLFVAGGAAGVWSATAAAAGGADAGSAAATAAARPRPGTA